MSTHAPALTAAPAESAEFDLETLAGAHNYNEWIYGRMRPYLGRRVLELGCGIGNLTPLFLREDRDVLAIDIETRMIEMHRQNVAAQPRLDVRAVAIQALVPTHRGTFDSVVSSNVLEHIPDGIEDDVIRASFDLLKPGGVSTHWVPAGPGIYGTIDETFNHCRRYTRARLRERFEKAGFKVERCRYWNAIGFFGWWWQGRVKKVKHIPKGPALLFDRWVVPVVSRIEPILPLPLGQSCWVVARKPQ